VVGDLLKGIPIRDAVSFSDVPKSHVNYEQITRLVSWMVQVSTKRFYKTGEMASVLAFGLTSGGNNSFKDVDSSHWASRHIAALADRNIAIGDENGNFRPNDNLTRAEYVPSTWFISSTIK